MSSSTVYENIFEAIRAISPNHAVLNKEGITGGMVRHQQFTCLDMGDGRVGAFPLELSPVYYRGESGLYDTCYSNLQRISDEEERIIWKLKTWDFISLLKRNPQIQRGMAQNEYIEFQALAQHYGFPTNMLDLTNDLVVAAYFATHEIDAVTGELRIKTEGIGRIRYSCEFFVPQGRLVPVGLQPLARPGQQSAFGIFLGEKEDYAASSASVQFRQSLQENQKLHQSVLGGPQLFFPNEPVTGLADRIKTANVVTREAVEAYCAGLTVSGRPEPDCEDTERLCAKNNREVKRLEGFLKKKGIYIVDAPVVSWLMLRDLPNSLPSVARRSPVRAGMIVG